MNMKSNRKIPINIIFIVVIISLLVNCVSTSQEIAFINTATPDFPATREARKIHAATWLADSTLTQEATERTPPPTKTPSLTPTITLTVGPSPTPTLTLVPTIVPPLIAHTWQPDHVLVEMWHSAGDGGFSAKYPPDIILYANGQLILSGDVGDFTYEPMTKILSRPETCALLNTIDQIGYFDYDDSTYDTGWDGGSITYIFVSTWRLNTSRNMMLWQLVYCYPYMETCEFTNSDLVILPAIRNTYLLLENYHVTGLQPYESDSLYVWLMGSRMFTATPLPWPLESLSLAELVKMQNPDAVYQPIMLEGEIISEWGSMVPNGVYYEGDLSLAVYSRPSWPMEYNSTWGLDIPDPSIPPPGFTLSCSPDDGILPIPAYP